MAELEGMDSAFGVTDDSKIILQTQGENGNDKSLGDDFEKLDADVSMNDNEENLQTSEIDISSKVGLVDDDKSVNNSMPALGLMSTSRPLVTTIEEEPEADRNSVMTHTNSALPDKSSFSSQPSEPLLDFDSLNSSEPVPATKTSLPSTQAADGDCSTDLMKPLDEMEKDFFGKVDIKSEKSAVLQGSGDTAEARDSQLEKDTLPNVGLLNLESELVGGFATPKLNEPESRACEPSAQTEAREGDIMETTEVSSSSEKSNSKPSASAADGCPFAPSAWFNPQKLNPTVADLVYWRDTKKSGVIFGSSLLLLLSLTYFSLISVVAYGGLAVLCVTISFRIYKSILQAVQKSNDGHPFKEFLEMDINLPAARVQQIIDILVHHVNCTTNRLRSLFFVEDLIDSLKFGVLLWGLTYIGAWFNGMTLIILGLVMTFTLPKFYETNKVQIDHYLDIVNKQVNETLSKVKAKIPLGKKKEQ